MEKVEIPNAAFASVLTSETGLQESQVPETRGKGWSKEYVLLVEEDQVREYLSKLDIHKSIGPEGMRPQVLRELANVLARPLSIIFDQSWRLGEVPEDWRKANATPIFKKEDPGNYRLISLTSTPGKVMEPLILETISRHTMTKNSSGVASMASPRGSHT